MWQHSWQTLDTLFEPQLQCGTSPRDPAGGPGSLMAWVRRCATARSLGITSLSVWESAFWAWYNSTKSLQENKRSGSKKRALCLVISLRNVLGFDQTGHGTMRPHTTTVSILSLKRANQGHSRQVQVMSTLPLKAISRIWGKFNELTIPYYLRVPGFKLYSFVFGVKYVL